MLFRAFLSSRHTGDSRFRFRRPRKAVGAIKPHSTQGLEALEGRCLLSGTLDTIASFASVGLKNPVQTLVEDSQGDIFGVANGGANSDGAIWEVAKNSTTITVVASFDGAGNGASPSGGLFINSQGTIYGVCLSGGANNDGTLWDLPQGSTTINLLGSFSTATAIGPSGQIYVDGSGNVFGTTQGNPIAQAGSIWEYNAGTQSITALVLFTAGSDFGANPHGGLVTDGNGNFYGTTFNGGTSGYGIIWKYHLGDGNVTPLANFDGATNGGDPEGGIAIDSVGDLFGTSMGNINTSTDSNVWELPANSNTIHTFGFFTGKGPYFFGGSPSGPVVLDSSGDLFGTAEFGGATSQGEIFEVPDATTNASAPLNTVYSFAFSGGHDPGSSLLLDSHGDIFGTTQLGGTKTAGTYFEWLAPGNIPSTHLAFTVQPTNTQANGTFTANVTVTIEGAGNQTAAFDDSAVALALDKGAGTLGGTTTVNAVDGVATFTGLSLSATGTFIIKATDGALKSALSHSFMVPLNPQMSFAQQPPASVVAGAKMGTPLAVNLKDQFGNLLTTNHSVMKLSIATGPTGGKLLGSTAVVAGGVASFKSLVIDKAGAYTLNITDGSISGLTTMSFNVTPAAASKMIFLTPPTSSAEGTLPAVQVELLDSFGNVVVNDGSTVTLALKTHPASASLGGTLTEPVSSGIASFATLTLTTPGTDSLEATDSNPLKPVISKPFTITA